MNIESTQIIERLDQILKFQKEILLRLDSNPIFDKVKSSEPEKQDKNSHLDQFIHNLERAIPYAAGLKVKFNLVLTPQTDRIIRYLDTGDPKAFDGLKRNS
jgi:hypothetical protein